MTRPVLVTRAEPGLAGTLARLERSGYAAIAAPTARIKALPVDPPPRAAALAVTSRNGASRAADLFSDRSLPVFAVGDASAEAARAHGFVQVGSAGGDGKALAELIAKDHPAGLLVHVRGRDQAFDLVADLKARGVTAASLVAYAAETAQALPAPAKAALREGATVLIHSARGAERFLALMEADGRLGSAPLHRIVAISRQAAAPCIDAGFARVDIAANPNEDSLLQALGAAPE